MFWAIMGVHIIDTLSKWGPILFGAIAIYFLLGKWNYQRKTKKFGAKPATNYLTDGYLGFTVGYVLLQHKKNGTLVDYLVERFNMTKHPMVQTIESKAFGKTTFATRDPENIKAILATQFNDFCLGTRHAQFAPLLGDGIFTLDGAGWKHSRTMLRPQFAREQVSHVQALESHIQNLKLQIAKHKGQKFDIQDYFYRYTVDAATEFLFGESVFGLQDASIGYDVTYNDEDGREHFSDAFNRSQLHISNRAVFQNLYYLYNPQDFKDTIVQVHKFADFYVNNALKLTPEELEKKSQNGYIFLYELVKQTRNPEVLRDQLLNILVAARDTTASLLSFTFFELARNPVILQKLQQEIWTNFGKGDDARIEDITFESLKKCEYLKAVINEILRLYPAVPQNFRVSQKDTTLPRGGGKEGQDPIFIPNGTTIMYSITGTHRDPQFYGKDFEDFRPERWFESETRKLGWAFLPFNGGPRICLGQQFALTEASYVISRLLQIFPHLQSFDEVYPPRKNAHLTLSLFDGCNIALY